MQPIITHPWDINETEALKLQRTLAARVVTEDSVDKIELVAGVDVAYTTNSDKLTAAVVIINAATLDVIETVTVTDTARFPYIPGLFSFRELPSLTKAFAKLKHRPDLVVCDGQGYAHPRRFGLACHLGVLFDIPTIGCGKTKLIGDASMPETTRGSFAPLIDRCEVIGHVLRTQTDINPIYVSVGHRVSLATACQWVLKLSPNYRLPETTRQADQVVRRSLKLLQ